MEDEKPRLMASVKMREMRSAAELHELTNQPLYLTKAHARQPSTQAKERPS